MNQQIQALRGIAILAVVIIHTYPANGLSGIVIRSITNFAVAMFIFLSGLLTPIEKLSNYEELTKQDINIFDTNSDFYTDLCFHFKSPIDGKDIPLKERLKLFFPNIT